HLRALANEGAAPDASVVRENLQALLGGFIPRVQVVALGQRDRRRSDEFRLQSHDGARRVTEHAVDALAELPVGVQLRRRLSILTFLDGPNLVADDPWLDLPELSQQLRNVDDQNADDGKVGPRLHADR